MSNPSLVSDYLPPVPADDTGGVQMSPPPAPALVGMVEVERYVKLYDSYVRLREDNFRLQRKILQVEHSLQSASAPRPRLQGDELKDALIDLLLHSSLNVESVPDDVERQIYQFVLNQISTATTTVSCFRKLFLP